MIKKIRKKFIIVAMSAIFIVLLAIMGSINVANFYKINAHANEALTILTDNGGVFPKPDKPRDKEKIPHSNMSPETPYETRYFTVLLDEDGGVIATNTGFIAAISTTDAADYAKKAFLNGKTSGFDGSYKYTSVSSSEDKILFVFLDCSRDLSTFYSFLAISVLVSFIGILSVFLLVLIFSKIAVRPIAESYEKQKRFITDAGHEIKTPLTIIDASTEVLELENGENEWTQSIKHQVKRLAELTSSLITLSRIDEQSIAIELTEFSLSDAICETLENFEIFAKTTNIQFKLNIEHGISYNGNEADLRKLVSILTDNAIKYTNDNGEIIISLEKQHRSIRLHFYNTVDEIEQGDLNILFERFYRRDLARSSANSGYGLGMSVAKAIVEAHKGMVSAESKDGKSILITITL